MMKRALIFDLDGTLFDTCEANFLAYLEALSLFGIHPDTPPLLEAIKNGENYREFLADICSADILEAVHERKKVLYEKYIEKAVPNKALLDLIAESFGNYKIVLFTTASKQCAELLLSRHDLMRFFDAIVAQEDVRNLKPSTDGYSYIVSRLNVEPKSSIVFEDSQRGVQAAIDSGFMVCKVCWSPRISAQRSYSSD